MDDELVERVLVAAEQIPRGRVASYGDLAELVGIGPRLVGRVMSLYGGNVAWWRVTSAAGELPEHLREEARARWADEGIAWKPHGRGCRIAEHRVDLARLARDYDRATSRLPGPGG